MTDVVERAKALQESVSDGPSSARPGDRHYFASATNVFGGL
ncbi:hypothetical protein [Mycobacterium sp. DBP42]|nr:hypothetical protein [Mycobacterium sp. DBP42]